MIGLELRNPHTPQERSRERRRRFGLDAPLPADERIVERAILRHLAECRPSALVLGLTRPAGRHDAEAQRGVVDVSAGAPDLLLALPGGRMAFLLIKTQARALTRAERAFADVCRAQGVPVDVVRSLSEAQRVLDRLGIPTLPETNDGDEKEGLARRPRQAAARR